MTTEIKADWDDLDLSTPSSPTQDISYVNAVIKCRGASTEDLTLSGEQTVDGIALVAGDTVCVKDQTDASENGVFIVSASAWSRHSRFRAGRELTSETVSNLFSILEGTANEGTLLMARAPKGSLTIGTNDITIEGV